ncbi:hypothetical protein [Methylovulum psychrotolerans]|uniref:Uncharacterized protein n=1 Tax=Methylovulum psychrotolerans TaxID=1704499 RepID=A0A1Z4C0D4_9GAMM|nr:hypothetical protein [Methylovulum psychrotolerans]ASF46997.1 hypothetical protein CEK71_13460 [Methylovulum psychrotolerans]
MSDATTPQLTPSGGSNGFIKLMTDKDGAALNPPQTMKIPAFVGIDSIDDKMDIKESNGAGQYAISLRGGKKKLSLSFTVDAFTGALLNNLYYGAETQAKQQRALIDNVGHAIPDHANLQAKIQNVITLNLSRWDSDTSVAINGTSATKDTSGTPVAGHYLVSAGKYTFAAADVNKTFAIAFDSNGTTVTVQGKIPPSLAFNVTKVASTTYAVKKQASGWTDGVAMIRSTFTNSAVPATGHFMASPWGAIILNPAETVGSAGQKMTFQYYCDGQTVTAMKGTLPDAGYDLYVDAPGDSLYISDDGVFLVTNSGTAMTGIGVGEALAVVSTGTPTSGQALSDGLGFYTFAAADVGDVVRIQYVLDYFSIVLSLPDGADYLEDLGVRTQGGLPFQRIAQSSPLSIATDQYYVNEAAGVYYFDYTNGGDTVFIDALVEEQGGNFIAINNELMGKSPTFMLVLQNEMDGESITVTYRNCKCLGTGIPLKQDPTAMKFDIQMFADRTTGVVGSISTSS